jgi:hypothetical protein
VSLDLSRYEDVDWDPEEQEDGNWQHCARPDRLGSRPDRVVDEVLRSEPVEFKMRVQTAEFSIVGPDVSTSSLWVVLFDTSHKRGDWLRPVTGWAATPRARQAWHAGRAGGTVRTWLNI